MRGCPVIDGNAQSHQTTAGRPRDPAPRDIETAHADRVAGARSRYRSRMPTDLADLPLPQAVIFDLDGTLVDTVETRIAAWLAALDEAGFPTTRDRLAPLIGVDGKRLARDVAALAGSAIDATRAEEIDRHSGELYERLNRSPRPLPGVRDLVDALAARRIPWSIATSSRKAQVATSVAALGLDSEPTILDASHVKYAKPEPDLLLLAARELGVEPARCWYVGDSTWDMVAAVAAGMIPVGVLAGAGVDDAALTRAGAAAVAGSLVDLVRVLATG
jgi:HAD superfamily hydrolase (TIGR01509 family)